MAVITSDQVTLVKNNISEILKRLSELENKVNK